MDLLPALVFRKCLTFEKDLKSFPHGLGSCRCAIDGVNAIRKASSDGLVDIDYCHIFVRTCPLFNSYLAYRY